MDAVSEVGDGEVGPLAHNPDRRGCRVPGRRPTPVWPRSSSGLPRWPRAGG
jgi:hypothetical protein